MLSTSVFLSFSSPAHLSPSLFYPHLLQTSSLLITRPFFSCYFYKLFVPYSIQVRDSTRHLDILISTVSLDLSTLPTSRQCFMQRPVMPSSGRVIALWDGHLLARPSTSRRRQIGRPDARQGRAAEPVILLF